MGKSVTKYFHPITGEARMEKLVEIHWMGFHDDVQSGDAIVEFIRYDEDGKIVNEVINVFLPEGIPTECHHACKTQAINEFHSGQGFEL